MKYATLVSLLMMSCSSMQSPTDSLRLCAAYCNSSGEDYSHILQMSYGTCICDNEAGKEVAEGYHEFLNDHCRVKPKGGN